MMPLEVRVLGPVDVVENGVVHSLAGKAHRALLAVLVLSIGHPVPVDQLIDAIWEDDPPQDAKAALQSLMSRLRHDFPSDAIEHSDGTYRLDLDPHQLDVFQFERHIAAAEDRLADDPGAGLAHARTAIELWRGEPYTDLSGFEPAMLEAHRLYELHNRAMELAWEASLDLGHHERVVGSLEAAVLGDPYREHLWYLLMVALSRSGRRVEALRAYDRLSGTLADLGLEPTADLRALADRIADDQPDTRPHFDPEPTPSTSA